MKATGGYIVMPPSRRNGRSYYVDANLDPITAPEWLVKLILTRPNASSTPPVKGKAQSDDGGVVITGPWEIPWSRLSRDSLVTELADALRFVPNNDLPWDEWTSIGLAIFAATRGSEDGKQLFIYFSKKSSQEQ